MKRLLITGSRHETDVGSIEAALREHGPGVVVHGGASGADTLAAEVAGEFGWPTEARPVTPKAWRALGRRAGPLRNQAMCDRGADVCLAFPHPDSVGTYDCAARAIRAGIPTTIDGTYVTEAQMEAGLKTAQAKIAREPDHAERVAAGQRRMGVAL